MDTPANVTLFQNGMVMVFDASGEQIPALQGTYKQATEKLKGLDLSQCRFDIGIWKTGIFLGSVSEAVFFDWDQLKTKIEEFKVKAKVNAPLLRAEGFDFTGNEWD